MASAAETRPWEPHERNYSGGRFGVWHDGRWTMLRVEAGIADATASIEKHEAWDLALRLSPPLKERLTELFDGRRKAEAAVYQFKYMANLAPLLRKIADEWDCDSSECEFAGSDLGALVCPCMDDERGCRAVEADELRQFAEAMETASGIEAPSGGETGNTDSTEGESPTAESRDAQPPSGDPR
jgi:hypothetical protein